MKFDNRFWGRFLEVVCKILMPVYVVFTYLNTLWPELIYESTILEAMESLYGFNAAALSFTSRVFAGFLNGVSCVFVVYILVLCIQLARFLVRGTIFSVQSADLFTRLRNISFCWAIYGMISMTLFSYLFFPKMTLKQFLIGASMNGLFYALVLALITVLAAVVVRGVRLQHDNDLTV